MVRRPVRLVGGLLVLVGACLLLPRAGARFLRPDLEKVPVERLAKNLEQLAEKNPRDVQVRINLARLHGMAYALKTDTTEVWKGKEAQGAWFGFTPPNVPFNKPVPTKDEAKQKAARDQLQKAIAAYDSALKIQPDNLAAQLGRAWCVEQAGDKAAAIKAYREVVEKGWQKEKDLKTGGLNPHYITSEAAGYLLPLLDPDKDKEEIATLKERSEKLRRLPRPITPIAIPLRDGLCARDLEAPGAAVAFDADGSGLKRKWSWITPEAAWLVHDPQRTGKVESALQLFGAVGFWLFWDHGYQALAALDDDQDGTLTGKELEGLALWHDANGDGVCDPGEVKPLAAYGIVALSCRAQRDPNHPDRIWYAPRGVTFRDGSTRPSFDLILKPR
jgi:tetratricopeptide (TPR) repeat protein